MTLCVADLVACACFMSFIPHVHFKPSSSGHESRRYKKEHINRRSTCMCLGASLHVIHIVHYWNMIMQYLQVDLDDRGMIESTDLEEVFEVWLNKTMFWGICWKSGWSIWLKPQNRESFRGVTIPIMHLRSLSLSCIRHPHLHARGVLWLLELNDVTALIILPVDCNHALDCNRKKKIIFNLPLWKYVRVCRTWQKHLRKGPGLSVLPMRWLSSAKLLVSLSLSLSLSLAFSLSLSFSLLLSLTHSLSLSLSPFPSLYLFISIYPSASLCLLYVSISLSVSLSVYLSLSVNLSFSVSLSIFTSISLSLSTLSIQLSLPSFLPPSLPLYLSFVSNTFESAYMQVWAMEQR
jgi:hypothetical protein